MEPDSSKRAYCSPFNRLAWQPDARSLSAAQWSSILSTTGASEPPFAKLCRVVDLIGHVNPDLKILCINASHYPEASRAMLDTHVGANRIKRFRELTLTDITPHLLESSGKIDSVNIKKEVLDMDISPEKQGFQAVYDVVLAYDAIEQCASPEANLQHCRELLKPEGKLVVLDSTDQDWNEVFVGAGFASGADIAIEEGSLTVGSRSEVCGQRLLL